MVAVESISCPPGIDLRPSLGTLCLMKAPEFPRNSQSGEWVLGTCSLRGYPPIAIVGIGCRFPRSAGPDAFWELLCTGGDAIGEIPPDRFLAGEELFDPRPGVPGRIQSRAGGFLCAIDLFDAGFFGISAHEASLIDPQQRLLLETAYEALEDGGQSLDRLRGRRVGVFVGMWTAEYEDRLFASTRDLDLYGTTGGGRYSASGRLSYVFDFRGPSVTVDTACSSSLVAVDLACKYLHQGDCEAALVGGVNLLLTPEISIAYSRAAILSPDGRCRFGDSEANGYVRSEGVGVVVLKPLPTALADRDRMYAVIVSTAVNNDGRTGGLLVAPGRQGQEAMLRQAYARAGICPVQVAYVEAHGTGTPAGDPVELSALGAVLSEDRSEELPCLVGSVKTNIGHTEAAAGIAGLIKTALCLHRRQIPPSLHFHKPNPRFPWHAHPLRVVTALTPWPSPPAGAVASVNSYGITGTNAHAVLAASPPAREDGTPQPGGRNCLLLVSARSEVALRELALAYAQRLAGADAENLAEVCAHAALRRTHHDWRLASVCQDADSTVARLRAFGRGGTAPDLWHGRCPSGTLPRVVFVFSGQGPQWAGMGRALLSSSAVFRDTLERIDTLLQKEAGWSLLEELGKEAAASRLQQTAIAQPALFAVQLGLAAVLRSWGLEPAALVGHSMGEVTAACVAGVLSLEDAVRVVCRRGQRMQAVAGPGEMAAVGLSHTELLPLIGPYGYCLEVAAVNGPQMVTLSGEPAALSEIAQRLESRSCFFKRLDVGYAFHSRQMATAAALLEQDLHSLRPQPASLPLYSTVRGGLAAEGEYGPAYWASNVRDTVLFAPAIAAMAEAGCTAFVEFSPQPVLSAAIRHCVQAREPTPAVIPTLRRDGDELTGLLGAVAALYVGGQSLNWEALFTRTRTQIALSAYAWQRQRFWFNERRPQPDATSTGGHPLLGRHVALAARDESHLWETEVSTRRFPWLEDHRVDRNVFLPAAGYLVMALEACRQTYGTVLDLTDVELVGASSLTPGEVLPVQVLVEGAEGGRQFHIHCRPPGTPLRPWNVRACGRLVASNDTLPADDLDGNAFIAASTAQLAAGEHYELLEEDGIGYGPTVRSVERVWVGKDKALARLGRSSETAVLPPELRTLDAAIQVLTVLARRHQAGNSAAFWTPAGLSRARFGHWKQGDEPLWVWVELPPASSGVDACSGDVRIWTAGETVVLEVQGLRLLQTTRPPQGIEKLLYEVSWVERPLALAPDARVWQTAKPRHIAQEVIPLTRDEVTSRPADGLRTSSGQRSWLVLAGRHPMAGSLADGLRAAGENSVLADTHGAGDLASLVVSPVGGTAARVIVDLRALDLVVTEDTPAEEIAEAHRRLFEGLMPLVRSLAGHDEPTRLVLVTRGVQAAGQGMAGTTVAVVQAPLWGFGRVVELEYPRMHTLLADLEGDGEESDAALLLNELRFNGGERHVAYRGRTRLGSRAASAGACASAARRSVVCSSGAAGRAA